MAHLMFEATVLDQTTEALYEGALAHGFVVCSAGTTAQTEMYRILRQKIEPAYHEMCRLVCELYRRSNLPMRGYDLRQVLDLTPKCMDCHKDVPVEGYCGYVYDTYAQNAVCCQLCDPSTFNSSHPRPMMQRSPGDFMR